MEIKSAGRVSAAAPFFIAAKGQLQGGRRDGRRLLQGVLKLCPSALPRGAAVCSTRPTELNDLVQYPKPVVVPGRRLHRRQRHFARRRPIGCLCYILLPLIKETCMRLMLL